MRLPGQVTNWLKALQGSLLHSQELQSSELLPEPLGLCISAAATSLEAHFANSLEKTAQCPLYF